MIEFVLTIVLTMFAVFVVGAVMLHILFALVFLPFQIALAAFKGVALAAFTIPFVALFAAIGIVVLALITTFGAACWFLCAIF